MPSRASKLLALIALLCAQAATSAESLAGGFTITTMGGRRNGGFANLASPDDPTAIFHNPAGLPDLEGHRLHTSMSYYLSRTRFQMEALDPARFPEIDRQEWPVRQSDNYYDRTLTPDRTFGVVPFLGATFDLGAINPDWDHAAAGIALYLPAFVGATMPERAPSAYHIVDGFFGVGGVSFAAGWRLHRMLSIGASVTYMYMRAQKKQRISITDSVTPAGQTPDAMTLLGHRMVGDITLDYTGIDHGAGWGVAVLFTPAPWISMALNYQGGTKPELEGDVSFRVADPKALETALDLFGYRLPRRLMVEMAFPHSINAGFVLKPTRWFEFAVDLRTWLYQLFDTQKVEPIYESDVSDDQKPFTSDNLSADKNYTLSYEICVGVLARPFHAWGSLLRTLEVMAGFSYDQSPVPDETFSFDNPSLSSYNVGLALRWQVTKRWRPSLTLAQYYYVERHVTNSTLAIPANGRGKGYAFVPGFELEYTFQ